MFTVTRLTGARVCCQNPSRLILGMVIVITFFWINLRTTSFHLSSTTNNGPGRPPLQVQPADKIAEKKFSDKVFTWRQYDKIAEESGTDTANKAQEDAINNGKVI